MSSNLEWKIREKIERIGKPLKNWDVKINYGIKTGYNDAFVINSETRMELIKKDPRSEEIIRPLLRGRDVKRYGYDFADLYLIATFPSLKIDIESYPSVKQHLESFGYDRLKQTGDIGARKKTNNKWFETQDSISYWDDFNRQKIVWKRVGSILRFSYDNEGILTLDSTCFATGRYAKYLVAVLNSKFGHYLLKDSPQTGTGDLLISVQAIEPLILIEPDEAMLLVFEDIIDEILSSSDETVISNLEQKISQLIYEAYDFSNDEIEFIEGQ